MHWQSYRRQLLRLLDQDLHAARLQEVLPQVQGPVHAGGALPFATPAAAAVAIAAAAVAIAPNDHDKPAAA